MNLRVIFLAAFVAVAGNSIAQTSSRPNLVVDPVNSTRSIVMTGNVHPLAQPQFDAGEAPQSQPMNRMMLVLGRSSVQEQTLETLLAAQQNAASPQFHQWLSPQQFGTQFGLSDSDVNAVTGWLAAHGFTDINVNAGRTIVEFSGVVQTVENAFSVSIHHYKVNGKEYSANTTDPHLPEALAPAVLGIVTLHNFPRHPQNHVVGAFTHESSGAMHPVAAATARPLTTIPSGSETYYGVSPYDFATIYNLLPLWTASSPVDGTGQTLAIVGETDIDPQDFINFRRLFNLPVGATTGSYGTQYLNIIYNGPDPGILTDGEETEADLDTQWSSSVARGATIDFVVSATTETAQGIDLSAEYIIDNNLAPVMSTSYGNCEFYIGSAGNAFYNSIYQQASAQGITVITSAGDSGPAGCDEAGGYEAIYGLAVSGMTSTPYNVSAGGTDFYMPSGGGSYWSSTNSSTTNASALSYIPEIPWNNSCGNTVLSSTVLFSGETPLQACNNSYGWYAPYNYLTNVGGGGGASSCTQPTGTTVGDCSVPYPKPAWQAGPGVPSDGVRDVPDISLFSGNGRYNAFYIVCEADYPYVSGGCNLTPTAIPGFFNFVGVGGTSAAAPAFAGIMALVNQQTGSRQGNANYVLYPLAAHQTSSCSAATGPASTCIFNDVTTGSIIIPCEPQTPNCTVPSSSDIIGVLSGYTTNVGYDQASGLGSVNITNLVRDWASATRGTTTTSLQLTPTTAVHGTGILAAATVTSSGTTPTGQVSFNGNAPNGSGIDGTLTNGQLQQTLNALPGGTYSITAHYAGDTTHDPSDSSPVSVTVSPEPSVEQIALFSSIPSYGLYSSIAGYTAPYGTMFDIRTDVTGKSGNGIATGTVTTSDNGTALWTNEPLSSDGSAEVQSMLSSGTHTIGVSYSGDPSFKAGSTTQQVSVTPMPMECSILSNSNIIRQGWNLQVDASSEAIPNVSGVIFYVANGVTATPTGTMTVYEGSTLIYGPTAITGHAGAPPVSSGGATDFTIPGSFNTYNVPAAQIFYPLQPITVTYSGDANFSSCTSAALPLTLQTGLLTSETSASNNGPYPTPIGTVLNFVATVQSATYPPNNDPAYPTPTGTITAMLDGTAYGTPLTLAIIPTNSPYYPTANFSLPTAGLSLGNHTIAFSYSGDSNYASSQAAYVLDLVAPTFSVSSSPYFTTVTSGTTTSPITVTVNPLYNFTGTVSFSCSGLPNEAACVFSPSTVNTSGSTTLTITTTKASAIHSAPQSAKVPMHRPPVAPFAALAAGLLAMFSMRRRKSLPRLLVTALALFVLGAATSCGSGGSAGGGSSSTPSGPATTRTVLYSSVFSPTENTPDTFTALVTGQGTASPTGSVIFYVDNSSTGTSEQLSTGQAVFTQTFAAGTHTVTAAYQGDANNLASTSSPDSVNVQYANGSIPGTYYVTITGTSGSITQATQIYLTVQ